MKQPHWLSPNRTIVEDVDTKCCRHTEGRLTLFVKAALRMLPAVVGVPTCALQAKRPQLTTSEAEDAVAVPIKRLFPEVLLCVRRTKLTNVVGRLVDDAYSRQEESHLEVRIMDVAATTDLNL